MKRLCLFLLFILAVLINPNIKNLSAQEVTNTDELIDVKYESINPDSDLQYTFKRLKEKLTLVLFAPFPNKKLGYYETLLGIRLAEYKYVVDKKDISNIQTVSQRYFTTAGELVDFSLKNSSVDRKKEIKETLQKQAAVVNKFKESFNDTTAEWRFVKHTSDYLDNYMSKL